MPRLDLAREALVKQLELNWFEPVPQMELEQELLLERD